jgi:membrane-associated protease RseP (regulator of RpoE activity)
VHFGLFAATVLSVFLMGAIYAAPKDATGSLRGLLLALPHGWPFAVPLLSILLCHELGHYFAARYHRVPASLPYFIPLPLLSPFGTMGAVISMPERIRSRDALLDIGAAGPLAGLAVAVPVLAVGLLQSPIVQPSGGWLEGQSLFYLGLKRLVLGPIPPGHDVLLGPMAFAGWAGLLVTVLNLMPIGQLDGGHIGYALLGPTQNKVARWLLFGLPLVFLYNLTRFRQVEPGLVWLVWFVLLSLLGRATGGNHPPTEPGELGRGRRAVAVGCLVVFVLLFMPTPMREGDPAPLDTWVGAVVKAIGAPRPAATP